MSIAPKDQWQQQAQSVINRMNTGKINAVGEFSLNAGVKSTTIRDTRIGAGTWLWPEAQDTAGALSVASGFFLTNRTNGTATLTFLTAPAATAGFIYAIIG
jgi:hypothetical protein